MSIEFFTWNTPNGRKISAALEEMELPYTVRPVDIGRGDQFAESFLKISPNNRIPAIVDPQGPDGLPISVFESGAILLYLAQKTGLTKKASVQLMDDFAALAYKEAKNVFVIPGLGKLVLANRKARMGRNPQTGEAIKIPAKRVLKFRVAKAAKDAILGKK